jgi:hypothetical protein
MRRFLLLLTLLTAALVLVVAPAAGQGDTTTLPPIDPNANISFPPPVYVLRGTTEIRGSANLVNMTGYFLEYRLLNADLTPNEDELWFPAILPRAATVLEDVLGVWDTTVTDDGLYELRMTINIFNGDPVLITVSPIRVENNPPPFVVIDNATVGGEAALPTQGAPGGAVSVPPTDVPVEPTPEPTQDTRPRVTPSSGLVSINVRSGDGTNFPAFSLLQGGQEAEIVGISATGSGWFQIRLPNGQIGWVSPTVVQVLGDTSGVIRVQPPPPPPPTAVPTLAATLIPAGTLPPVGNPNINLVAGILVLNPATPRCNEAVAIGFDVANLGSAATTTSGRVTVTDFRVSDNSVQGTTFGDFPPLQPNTTTRVNMFLTVSTFYNEQHRLVLEIDAGNTFGESNRTDNRREVTYTLDRANCP